MPKMLHPKKTQKYSEEFKSKAVQLSLFSDVKIKDVAKTLDIHPFMLSRWRKEFREGKLVADKRKKVVSFKKEKNALDKLHRLEKENSRLKQEIDLLKKWQRFLAEERHKKTLGVQYLCDGLKISRSGYYAWRKRPESQRSNTDQFLLKKIRKIHTESRETYGSPSVCQQQLKSEPLHQLKSEPLILRLIH